MVAARPGSRGVFSAIVAIGAAAFLASCSGPVPSHVQFSSAKYGVAASPRVVAFGQQVPRGGGHYIVGDPYRVAGRTYIPRDNPRYSEIGLASWYGDNFHGRLTANGEVYDVQGLSAAHPTMPLPSYARVTNLANGRSIVVRVNDRGPYAGDRIIDVSSTVASILDFKRVGTARVKVDYVGPARMDGMDGNMLMASYAAPGARPSNSLFAAARAPAPPASFVIASAPAAPRAKPLRPIDAAFTATDAAPMVLMPAYAPTGYDDPLAPLILRTGFASSYAAPERLSPAHQAAAILATNRLPPDDTASRLKTALDRAAAVKAKLLAARTLGLADADDLSQ
jgi:rare lipoprotein A